MREMEPRIRHQQLAELLAELARVRAELIELNDELAAEKPESRGPAQMILLGRALRLRARHLRWQIEELTA